MKDIHKNPFFYYILIPVLAAVFPAIVWGVFLPGARKDFNDEKEQFVKGQTLIEELLKADPDRLDFNDRKGDSAGFDYATAVAETTEFCSIQTDNYVLSSRNPITTGGQKSQSATVTLKDVDITRAARFLSHIQLRWSGLQCTDIKLRKQKGLPDSWDVAYTFKYVY